MSKKITKISFGSYVKFFMAAFLCLGLLLGTIGFLMALLDLGNIGWINSEVQANPAGGATTTLTGVIPGLLMILIFPIVFAIVSIGFSLFSYPIFYLLLKKRGLKLDVEMAEIEK